MLLASVVDTKSTTAPDVSRGAEHLPAPTGSEHRIIITSALSVEPHDNMTQFPPALDSGRKEGGCERALGFAKHFSPTGCRRFG